MTIWLSSTEDSGVQCDLYAYDAGNDPPQAPHAVISIEENRETQDFDDNDNP